MIAIEFAADWTAIQRGRPLVTAYLPDEQEPILRGRVDLDSVESCGRYARHVNRVLRARNASEIDETDAIRELQRLERPSLSSTSPPAVLREQERLRLIESTDATTLEEARDLLLDPCLVQRMLDDLHAMGLVGEEDTALTIYLAGTSRLLPRPVSLIVVGSSSSGKSFIIESVTALFPPETVVRATDFTPNSLYYLPPGALEHLCVVGGERSRKENDDRAEATRALREMLSSGVLRKAIPEKDANGKFVTRVIENKGPISFIESTTLSTIFEEDANRCLITGVDESNAQTRRIIDRLGEDAARGQVRHVIDTMDRHHTVQRLLERVPVDIPFAPRVVDGVPADRIEARRAVGHVLSLVKAAALLHQHQRKRTGDGAVVADFADYAIARRLLRAPLARAVADDVPEHVRAFGLWLRDGVGSESFTPTTLLKRGDCTWKRSRIYDHLKALEDAGLVEKVEQVRGAPYRLIRAPDRAAEDLLPSLMDIGASDPPDGWTDSAFLASCWTCESTGALDVAGLAGQRSGSSSESSTVQQLDGLPTTPTEDSCAVRPELQPGGRSAGASSALAAEEIERRRQRGLE